MMTDTASAKSSNDAPGAGPSTQPSQHEDKETPRNRDVIAAGAVAFMLSGDLRLATRATRLLISDEAQSFGGVISATRSRRVWKRRR
jgi:hypothetical protein